MEKQILQKNEELSLEFLREKYNDFLKLCREVSAEASNQNLNKTPQKGFSC